MEGLRNYFGDYNYPPLNPRFRYILLGLISVLYFTYFMGVRSMIRDPKAAASLPPWWMMAVLVYAAAIPPLFSIDLYEYVLRGRMSAIYGLNPFTCTPHAISGDPLYPIIFWKGTTSCYGPLWNLFADVFVKISGASDVLNVITFKTAALAAHIASGLLVYQIARKIEPAKCGVIAALFTFNPYLIFMNLVENHNDVFMILFVLLAVRMVSKEKYTLAIAALAMSVAVKYVTAVLVPVFFMYVYMSNLSIRSKVAFTLGAGASFALLFYAVSRPFGMTPLNILESFKTIAVNLETNTFPFLTYKLISAMKIGISVEVFRSLCNAAFIAAAGVIYLSLTRKRGIRLQDAMTACVLVLAAYFLVDSFQFGNWYAVWLTPFILLSGIKRKNFLFMLVTFAALIAFWKRINFLMIAAMAVYFAAFLAPAGSRLARFLDEA